VLLIRERHFVTVDLAAVVGVRRLALAVLSAQLLVARSHLHHDFAADVLRALSDDLADLAHGRELLRFFDALITVLLADSALAILRVAALFVLAVAAALPRLSLLRPLSILVCLPLRRRRVRLRLARHGRSVLVLPVLRRLLAAALVLLLAA